MDPVPRVVVSIALAIAVTLGQAGRAEAHPTNRPPPAAPLVFEWVSLGIAAPHGTLSVWTGMHGWLADHLYWAARVYAVQVTHSQPIRDHVLRLTTGEAGPYFEGDAEIGVPLRRSVDDGVYYFEGAIRISEEQKARLPRFRNVDELDLVAGVRWPALRSELAIPVGLRLSHRESGEHVEIFQERWIEARILVFAPTSQVGLDAEVGWMPRPFGLAVFFEWLPRLGAHQAIVECGTGGILCEGAYPDGSSFNPIPESGLVQLGLRVRLHHPF
jgi:hypothetical protein